MSSSSRKLDGLTLFVLFVILSPSQKGVGGGDAMSRMSDRKSIGLQILQGMFGVLDSNQRNSSSGFGDHRSAE